MNMFKGVADLLRRTSSEHSTEPTKWTPAEKFSPPSPRIIFRDVGDEEILGLLWKKHESTIDKVEKRRLFHVFLKQFLVVYKSWKPLHSGQLPDSATKFPSGSIDILQGCAAGHPAEIILVLTQEITEITALVTELNTTAIEPTTYQLPISPSVNVSIISEGLAVLDGLTIITRSMHNCRVFGYYGGMQKLIALVKAAVVQLKTVNGALVADDNILSQVTVENTKLLQKILVYAVSIICSFIDLNPNVYDKAQLYSKNMEFSLVSDYNRTSNPSSSGKQHLTSERHNWQQKAIVSVMEAGGLNWLVELLRVIRRLSMKEQWTDMSLQYLTLCTLNSALSENPRAQNHFRSIGGLEVLLDGLGFPSKNAYALDNMFGTNIDRYENSFWAIFQLQVLSLKVLRESVFGNLSNLQFLCESGRLHKFANSICWPAFMLQEMQLQRKDITNTAILLDNASNNTFLEDWNAYAIRLSRVLCSFLLAVEDIKYQSVHLSEDQIALPASSVYCELSIKWVMKVLLTVFPCVKACCNLNELPSHLRILIINVQQYVLYAFRKILVSLPQLLEVFREEGIWELIFSENFFYFGASFQEEFQGEYGTCTEAIHSQVTKPTDNQWEVTESQTNKLQMEILSFVEYAATISGNVHNLPECSIILDSLEQSACQADVALVLSKSLHYILQLAVEETVASFKTLNAVYRLLRVASIQTQELGRSGNLSLCVGSWLTCIEAVLELFSHYLSFADDAKLLVLRNSLCVDCLFDLFWEKRLRKHALAHIFDLMKLLPISEEDQVAKLYLCSKYLETFTCIKEKETNYAELSIDLLLGVRDMVETDQMYYQALFRDGECFLHIVSLLNGFLDEKSELLVLNVLQTLKLLLSANDASKDSFRGLVGKGYQTLQSLLLDFCESQPSERLLNALLDMLVDGNFDMVATPLIKNEDVIILFLTVLQKSSESLRHYGLNVFQQLLRDSISNRASCDRAGMLDFLLDWFCQEVSNEVVLKIALLIQVIGGHSISGKDIRKIFSLLHNEKIGTGEQHCSLLLNCILSMLHEKGPTAFFNLKGHNSGIVIKTPLQWPQNKGFSFSCWLRVENYPSTGAMGLFNFLTETGRGCFALLGKETLLYESFNQKRQCVSLQLNLAVKKWHFLCVTHSIGRAFSGGSFLRCYIDGNLVSSEKCSYSKVSEALTHCTVGTAVNPVMHDKENPPSFIKESSPFFGQIGPIYMFGDSISSEQIQSIYSLGPSYMYTFLDNDVTVGSDSLSSNGIFDVKDGLASKIIFGLNAQAGDGKHLFNVAPMLDHPADKISLEASVLSGTQLCSRRLLQEIIYCVGGVSVFFPLLTQFDRLENPDTDELEDTLFRCVIKDRPVAEVIMLIASVLDENVANQQQMNHISGFRILGFLLQSVHPQKMNLESLSALKHLLNVVASCELLVKDAISSIFLNPFIWVHTVYKVQRELYMFLIQQFDNDPRLLSSLCCLPHVIDVIRLFYGDKPRPLSGYVCMPLLVSSSKEATRQRPSREDIHKIRLLLLSLGEMSLRQNISALDIKVLIAFFERSKDMTCIQDVLHMVTRAVSQKPLLASFLEQVNLLGGCHLFVNLLERDFEPVRLLCLQFLGRLLVGLPSEKKGPRFFNLAVGRSKSISEGHRKIDLRLQPIFSAISDRLFKYPQTDLLCATLFDVLLGGASPKQVLQKQNQPAKQKSTGNSSHFLLPQMLVLIFRFLAHCDDTSTRMKILSDLLDLLDSSHSNLEALMEYGWNSWLATCLQLDVVKNYNLYPGQKNEEMLVRNLFCDVLSYYINCVKSGWHQLEETVDFLLLHSKHGAHVYLRLLNDIFEDIIVRLAELSSQESIFVSQPCRDNTLYLLKLIDEMAILEMENKLPYPASWSDLSADYFDVGSRVQHDSSLVEALDGDRSSQLLRNQGASMEPILNEDNGLDDKRWNFYDKLWVIINEMIGKSANKMLPKSSSSVGPSFGQRARGLVESLNIPAAEMAAVVVSGGIGNALGGKSNKAMILRGEKCPRLVFRLVILYLCKSSLDRASRCVQQVLVLLPFLLAVDDEQNRVRLQFFIWSLLNARLQYGALDNGARYHVISQLIRETVNWGKPMLATSIISKDDSSESESNITEVSTIQSLIQKDKILVAVADEAKYIKTSKYDRTKQLLELRMRMDENFSVGTNYRKSFEDEIQSTLSTIVSSDDNRKFAFQLAHDEDQQVVAEQWIHMFRTLIDERGPWSANPFPNDIITHWKLDKTEDSRRRRPKLKRNYHFDQKLCHPPPAAINKDSTHVITEAKSDLGSHIPEQMKLLFLKGVRKIIDARSPDSENDLEASEKKDHDGLGNSVNTESVEYTKDCRDEMDFGPDRKDPSPNVMETENNEVLMSSPCVLVTPKRKVVGHLAVLKNVLHFFDELLVEGAGGSSVFNNFQTSNKFGYARTDQLGAQKQSVPKVSLDMEGELDKGHTTDNPATVNCSLLQKETKVKRHRRWSVCKIKSVHWTRYLLRYTAVEIFFGDSVAPVFFNFPSRKVAKDIGMLIVSSRNESMFPKGTSRDRSGTISFVDRRVAQEMAEIAQESWKRRDITNFEYLMILNTLAGRSYNDLTQYPVFPWVLADFSSDKLDFNTSSTFRDLSKPVGALDSKRLEVFEDRYQNFSDPDIPSFYYGSHYSSMGIVLYYLLRLEPFTALHRSLQGGKFDHADRLFQSIEGTYKNCLSNTSDVKELIPEFFYMPEFLYNSNSYHLGIKQDGEPLGDVCLPPWAKGSPEEFVNRNREALESEYVSSNLHNWIDLIFGYKQRGKPAVEAANVFYYLTYEGAVDLDATEDELQRAAIEDQISNFGQTPIQVFRKKHSRRGPPIPIAHPLHFAPSSIDLTSIVSTTTHSPPSAILYIGIMDSTVVLVNQGLTMSVKMWLTTQLQSGGNFTFSGSQDPFFGIGSDILSSRNIGRPLAENVELGSQYFAKLHLSAESYLISCGNWENSFQIISLSDGRTVQTIRQHKDVVSCVAVTSDGNFMATGSYDTTVIVWEVSRLKLSEKKVRNAQPELLRKDYVINATPFHILCGHDDIITCVFVSVDLDIVISGSKDGTCIFHTLREGRYIRSLKHPSGSALSKLVASQHGRIIIYADDDLSLHMYSINGKHLATSESNGRLNCVELSSCGEFLVCAGDQGQIVVRSMNSLEVVKRYDGVGKVITSLTVTPEECFLAGTKDGILLVYSIENHQFRKPSLPRNVKYKA